MQDKPIVSIMIVENDQKTIDNFTTILEGKYFKLSKDREFYFIDTIKAAEDYYQQLYNVDKAPDIVILSFEMEQRNNFALSNHIRNADEHAFILAAGSQTSEENVLAARINKMDGFITTPPVREVVNGYLQQYFQNVVARASEQYFDSVKEKMKWNP